MLITGVRHRVKLEIDAQRTDVFKVYLLHYLKMFTFLGIIFPALVGVDYFLQPKNKEESIVNKHYIPIHANQVDYYVYTESYRFRSDPLFFEKAYVGDKVVFQHTPIFKIYTYVALSNDGVVYKCALAHIYGWTLIIVIATFVLSSVLGVNFFSKQKHIKQDLVINIGIVNALLCCIVIMAVLFQKLH